MLDGQMAHIQGQSFDNVQMEGRPWALEGYRLMDAQSIASSMLAAQRAEIANGGYEMSPDQFRSAMAARVTAMTEGMDPRTAELVQMQMVEQMQTLFNDHTTQHLAYQEQEAFNSLERSIDVVSRDPTSVEQLIAFAEGGEDSPSAGLSDDRRTAAVVSGIVRAFDNDNPLAYSAIMGSGVLGESLTSEQLSTIRSARQRFQTRRRTELNTALLNEETALMDRLEAGELTPEAAVEAYVDMYGRHGIEMTMSEAMQIHSQADTIEETENRTASVLIEDATLREDWDTVAQIGARAVFGGGGYGVRVTPGQSSIPHVGNLTSDPAVRDLVHAAVETVFGPNVEVRHTSGFRNNDTDGDGIPNRSSQHGTGGATDFHIVENGQIVPWNDPRIEQMFGVAASYGARGFGAGPTYMSGTSFHIDLGLGGNGAPVRGGVTVWSDDDGGAADRGAGAAQWYQSIVNAGSGTGGLSSEESEQWSELVSTYQGNVVHAAVAMEFGADAVQALEAGTATAAVMARAEAVQGTLDNWRAPTAADRLNVARGQLDATRRRVAMDAYEEFAPRVAEVDDAFARGEMDEGTWRERRTHLYERYDQARTEADVNNEIAQVRAVDAAHAQAVEQARDTEYALALEAAQAATTEPRLAFEAAMEDESLTPQERQMAAQQYREARQAIFDEYGIQLIDRGNGAVAEQVIEQWTAGEQAHRAWAEGQAIIGNANTSQTVGTLPRDLQQRALGDFRNQLDTQIENMRAENPDVPEAQVEALRRDMEIDYIAQNGIIDEATQQMVNLAASGQGWINRQGEPNPSVVAGLHTFASIYAANPDLAYQYVSDPEAQGRMLAAMHQVQAQFPDTDAFASVDLSNRNDPLANAFHAAVEQVGLGIERPATPEQTAARVARAMDLMDRGNITGTAFGGLLSRSPSGALLPTVGDAAISGNFDVRDRNAAYRLDRGMIDRDFSAHVTNFIETVTPYMPAVDQHGAVTMALDFVRERGAVMGNGFVMPRANEPSITSQMFPGQQVSNTAAVNTAIANWMSDEGTRESNPVLAEYFEDNFRGEGLIPLSGDATAGTRISPVYSVSRHGEHYVATIPGYGSVVLPLAEIGDLYTSTR
jgi:hypothetical protein